MCVCTVEVPAMAVICLNYQQAGLGTGLEQGLWRSKYLCWLSL
jgi:hypothetical protein